MEDSSRPSTPQRSAHDNLMEAIRGSSIKQLRRVSSPRADPGGTDLERGRPLVHSSTEVAS